MGELFSSYFLQPEITLEGVMDLGPGISVGGVFHLARDPGGDLLVGASGAFGLVGGGRGRLPNGGSGSLMPQPVWS